MPWSWTRLFNANSSIVSDGQASTNSKSPKAERLQPSGSQVSGNHGRVVLHPAGCALSDFFAKVKYHNLV